MPGLLEPLGGFGGKLIPVPWNALQLQADAKTQKSSLTLNKTSDDLKNAPTVDKNHMSNFTDAKWAQSVNDFFGVSTVAQRPDTNR